VRSDSFVNREAQSIRVLVATSSSRGPAPAFADAWVRRRAVLWLMGCGMLGLGFGGLSVRPAGIAQPLDPATGLPGRASLVRHGRPLAAQLCASAGLQPVQCGSARSAAALVVRRVWVLVCRQRRLRGGPAPAASRSGDFPAAGCPACGSGESCPDFSAGGAPLRFGFERRVSLQAGGRLDRTWHRQLEVQHLAAVE